MILTTWNYLTARISGLPQSQAPLPSSEQDCAIQKMWEQTHEGVHRNLQDISLNFSWHAPLSTSPKRGENIKEKLGIPQERQVLNWGPLLERAISHEVRELCFNICNRQIFCWFLDKFLQMSPEQIQTKWEDVCASVEEITSHEADPYHIRLALTKLTSKEIEETKVRAICLSLKKIYDLDDTPEEKRGKILQASFFICFQEIIKSGNLFIFKELVGGFVVSKVYDPLQHIVTSHVLQYFERIQKQISTEPLTPEDMLSLAKTVINICVTCPDTSERQVQPSHSQEKELKQTVFFQMKAALVNSIVKDTVSDPQNVQNTAEHFTNIGVEILNGEMGNDVDFFIQKFFRAPFRLIAHIIRCLLEGIMAFLKSTVMYPWADKWITSIGEDLGTSCKNSDMFTEAQEVVADRLQEIEQELLTQQHQEHRSICDAHSACVQTPIQQGLSSIMDVIQENAESKGLKFLNSTVRSSVIQLIPLFERVLSHLTAKQRVQEICYTVVAMTNDYVQGRRLPSMRYNALKDQLGREPNQYEIEQHMRNLRTTTAERIRNSFENILTTGIVLYVEDPTSALFQEDPIQRYTLWCGHNFSPSSDHNIAQVLIQNFQYFQDDPQQDTLCTIYKIFSTCVYELSCMQGSLPVHSHSYAINRNIQKVIIPSLKQLATQIGASVERANDPSSLQYGEIFASLAKFQDVANRHYMFITTFTAQSKSTSCIGNIWCNIMRTIHTYVICSIKRFWVSRKVNSFLNNDRGPLQHIPLIPYIAQELKHKAIGFLQREEEIAG